MAPRSIEVRKIAGLQELLDSSIFHQRAPLEPPSREDYGLACGAARQMLTAALQLIGDSKTAVFAVAKWPADDLAQYGILVALNPRFKTDPFTGLPYFAREFRDGVDQTGRLYRWADADDELVHYCTTQFGKPTLVK